MGKIRFTTKWRLVSATHPLVSYHRLAAGVAVMLGAGLIAAAPAHADDDLTVGAGLSPASRPAPLEMVHGPARVYYGQSAQRTMGQHRRYYGDRYWHQPYRDRYYRHQPYRDRYYGHPRYWERYDRDACRHGHYHCRHRRYRYGD